MSDEVLAAGGVVGRGRPGAREVLLVHRRRYDDWTHPKGKLETGESFQDGARREVLEETGWQCELGPELPSIAYPDARGRPKRVRYWMMHPALDSGFTPGAEVDTIRWTQPVEARALLSYPRDVETLEAALALDAPIYVVRHAKAGSRRDWRDDDDRRPISAKGARQAARLLEHLGLDRVHRVVSSPSLRCVQTVAPMAEALSLPLERHDALREATDVGTALALLAELAGPSVACTHGDIVQAVVLAVSPDRPRAGVEGWKKGSTWILERDAGRPVEARYVAPPRDRVG
ncbi:MAG: NUDIX hydrolase [Actinomycetota bacterium]